MNLFRFLIPMRKGVNRMYSKRYETAKKEFKNCLWMSIVGLGVPVYYAFHEWLPIMRREKKRALMEGNAQKQ